MCFFALAGYIPRKNWKWKEYIAGQVYQNTYLNFLFHNETCALNETCAKYLPGLFRTILPVKNFQGFLQVFLKTAGKEYCSYKRKELFLHLLFLE